MSCLRFTHSPALVSIKTQHQDARRMSTSKIKRLDALVVNRIAAGEIIVQPANALKEMLENAIDAGASAIDVVAKDGGLKLLQIIDNGCGIALEDLPLLCERFATLKLRTFEDLSLIATYGFRGEALASISHIARLSVVLKVAELPLAYRACYLDGELCTPHFKKGDGTPRPIAGKNGTSITVEDLFYNLPSRLRALQSKSDEWSRILDVVGRYAVHTEQVGFSCKKFGDAMPAISTRASATLKERVRAVFGTVAIELIEFSFKGEDFGLVAIKGAVSGATYSNKRRTPPVFFINNRLVACEPLKRAITSVFQVFLPKGNHPFVYLSLEILPQNLDVNVHPTKREVRFLFEDEIIEWVSGKLHDVLAGNGTTKTFKQSTLKRDPEMEIDDVIKKKNRQENKLVRTDAAQLKITQFAVAASSQPGEQTNVPEYADSSRKESVVLLDSIHELRDEVSTGMHRPLTNVFNNLEFVGIIDPLKRLCCFQYDVKLFVCDYGALLGEFYYQLALALFANFGEYTLDVPLPLDQILAPLYADESLGDLQPMESVMANITNMSDMFREYFQILLSDGVLLTLPIFMKSVLPSEEKLPYFIYRLGTKVDYTDEKKCLKEILRQIALLYIPQKLQIDMDASLVLEHVVFPELRRLFIAPEHLLKLVVQVADLPGLYRVFERC